MIELRDDSADSKGGPSRGRIPPPLPPRANTQESSYPTDAPPPYESVSTQNMSENPSWTAQDPRSASTDSLVPADNNKQAERRKLLCIYIHGFMGDVTSFQSFPAHVHNLLTVLLVETHVVHTKLYPKYRSKRNISYARDDFSTWLDPHEDSSTDVVLLGHSMGGLLSAEVVLKQPPPPASRPLMHRVLGTINFDVPFLGMHPGVIKSGLASIFAPAAPTPQSASSPTDGLTPTTSIDNVTSAISPVGRTDTLWARKQDQNFNPAFPNDVNLPVRKGWEKAWHFVNKHSNDLTSATKNLVTSHLEYGGAMADYNGLRARYAKIRALEEEDENLRKTVTGGMVTAPRVRFVNYYTAATGRPKPKPKEESPVPIQEKLEVPDALNAEALRHALQEEGVTSGSRSRSASPSIKLEEVNGNKIIEKEPEFPAEGHEEDGEESELDMNHMDPQPVSDSDAYSDREDWHDAEDDFEAQPERHDPLGQTVEEQPQDDSADRTEPSSFNTPTGAMSPLSMQQSDSMSMLSLAGTLPPIPDEPVAPPPLDTSYITDKDTKKLVEKEHARATKTYRQAVKDREKALSDRARLEKKRELKAKKDSEKAAKDTVKMKEKAERDAARAKQMDKQAKVKQAEDEWKLERRETEKEMSQMEGEELRLAKERERMAAEARRMRGEKTPPGSERPTRSSTTTTLQSTNSSYLDQPSGTQTSTPTDARSIKEGKAKEKEARSPKERNFCSLPPKDSHGQRDPCWVRVLMKDVDEVGAHCGLFFVGEAYEKLVGDVAERIESWVTENEGGRVARQLDGAEKLPARQLYV